MSELTMQEINDRLMRQGSVIGMAEQATTMFFESIDHDDDNIDRVISFLEGAIKNLRYAKVLIEIRNRKARQ